MLKTLPSDLLAYVWKLYYSTIVLEELQKTIDKNKKNRIEHIYEYNDWIMRRFNINW